MMQAYTEEQRKALIEYCKAEISCARTLMLAAINIRDGVETAKWESQLRLQEIALAALKAEPVAWIVHGHGGDQLTADGDYVADVEGMHGARASSLYTSPPVAAQAVPDGFVMVPRALTAENGAKAALLGEFNLEYSLECHECFGEGCDDCSGEGRWINSIPVDWTTIKEIWAKGIEHFQAAAPEVD